MTTVIEESSFLKVKNRVYSKLAAAITVGATSLTVTSGDGGDFPDTYPFHLTIEDEIVSVTNRVGDAMTIVREQQSTTAATHANNTYVALNITAKNISDLNAAVNTIEQALEQGINNLVVNGTADYPVDLYGATVNSGGADIRLSNGALIDNSVDGTLKLQTTASGYVSISEGQIIAKCDYLDLDLDVALRFTGTGKNIDGEVIFRDKVTVGRPAGAGVDFILYGATANYRVMWDANGDTNGRWTFGDDDYGMDVAFRGATAGVQMLWDASDNSLNLTGAKAAFGGNTDWGVGATGTEITGAGYDWVTQTVGRVNTDINNTAAAAAYHALSITVSQANSNSFFGTWTELYLSNSVDLTGADNVAAVWGQIEAGTNVTLSDTGCFTAGGYFNIIAGSTLVIAAGHSVNGVRAQLEVSAVTNNGTLAAFECLKSGGVDWEFGLYLADCTTDIRFQEGTTLTDDGTDLTLAGANFKVGNDVLHKFGADSDIVLLNRSTSLTANTTLTGVFVGTPITPALAANSLIISNVTASGDIVIATANSSGDSQANIFVDSSAGSTHVLAAGVSQLNIALGRVNIYDDIILQLGTGGDQALVNRSTSLTANTALGNVLIGTPVTPAITANSLIISNVTSNGDILVAANDGGTSKGFIFCDASTPDLYLYNVGGTWTAGATTWTIPAVTLGGAVSGNAQTISNANVTVGASRTLDVSAGTLTLADNQISGDKVEGGTIASTTITTLSCGTLNGVGTIDATTEATIETAIDTLANLVSVQGHTVTLTGDFIRSGAHSLTLTTTGVTDVTLPTTGTLATLAGTEVFSNKTFTAPVLTQDSWFQAKDSGGTARGIILMFSNVLYIDNDAASSIAFRTDNASGVGNQTTRMTLSGNLATATLTFANTTIVGAVLGGALDVAGQYITFLERAAPGAGAANEARMYAVVGGDTLTDLAAVFQDGTIDIFAQESTEPHSPIFQFPDNTNLKLVMRKPDRKTIQFVALFPDGREFVMRELRYPVEKW